MRILSYILFVPPEENLHIQFSKRKIISNVDHSNDFFLNGKKNKNQLPRFRIKSFKIEVISMKI
jgi:hypothetical protein